MQPSWWEHVDLMQVLLVGCLVYITWSFRTMVTDFKKMFADLYDKYNNLADDFHELKGEHKARRKSDKGEC